MAFDEKLSDRIRAALVKIPKVEEKYMFGGVCYMVNGKMCVGVVKDEMMCRIDPAIHEGQRILFSTASHKAVVSSFPNAMMTFPVPCRI